MWTSLLLPIAFAATSVLASGDPPLQARTQITFNSGSLQGAIERGLGRVDKWVSQGVRQFDSFVHGNGMTYELITHTDFPKYSIRLKEPKLCDDTVKSYSGYLDLDVDNHSFFWFFESRSKNPAKDPLVLWLNGGPGCSSSTGLLFELGPCSITDEGKNTTWNKYSWTESANVIFLDSPINVGYSKGSKTVANSQDTAKDVYAFLQLFYEKFPKFSKNDFHVTGESYAGTYIPNIASVIFNNNKNLDLTKSKSIHIPLASMAIGNGLTDTYTQFASIPTFSCGGGIHEPIFDEQTCASLQSKVDTCQRLTPYCYKAPSRFTCVPATLACWQTAGPIQSSGLNPYDITKKCDRDGEDGPLCYKQMQWIETYLNQAEIRKELGADPDTPFTSCNMQINQAFTFNGDVAHNTAALIPEMLEAGIKLLVYAGDRDFMCNYIGNLDWTLALLWSGQAEYNQAKLHNFTMPNGHAAGLTKSYGGMTYMQVYEAGHMVPYDKPKEALEMITRWMQGGKF
ncbi:BZ3500_MvSof-1268-A1-R1_Chr6-3g08833 [Microbotryum saponariae]|uniref:Carboxypeptidase n=1 Tax=Microbotryum saponariae TaxID=289078 RepID=A0A2X0LK32_9BASI|nr:BZ3500_MvSof-1268-A1-R1_Chr6-3g08833 [Microbotryum saponariae]SDA07434.1 BZ3501_MvSof-1269-A2-R1_Chr6-2g08536 [Microbotryum saponariae]